MLLLLFLFCWFIIKVALNAFHSGRRGSWKESRVVYFPSFNVPCLDLRSVKVSLIYPVMSCFICVHVPYLSILFSSWVGLAYRYWSAHIDKPIYRYCWLSTLIYGPNKIPHVKPGQYWSILDMPNLYWYRQNSFLMPTLFLNILFVSLLNVCWIHCIIVPYLTGGLHGIVMSNLWLNVCLVLIKYN